MLVLHGLTKKFGDFTAVDNLSLEINDGEVFGLLGANGAGKTTTLRMLATMLAPTSGRATVEGFDVVDQPATVRKSVGLLFGGDTGLYDRLSARENIEYFAQLNDMPAEEASQRVEQLAQLFSFTEFLDKWTGKLSKGTRQKVAFARAIINNPKVMLFDEPTTGLDITSRQNVEEFIDACRRNGSTIILSDHNLDSIERVCDRIGILDHGRLIGVGTVEELCRSHGCASLKDVFFKLATPESGGVA